MTKHIRTWEGYDGELPRPLNILVYRRRARGGSLHAHCIQFAGVYARGETQESAIEEALRMLLHHLYESQIAKTRPMRMASQIYQDAFYTGKTVPITSALESHLPVKIRLRE